MSDISFGADPEMMVVDKKGNLKSAIGIVPGKKEERYELGGGHRAYYDNVLAEVEIKPSKSGDEAVANFKDCFNRLGALIKPYKVVIRASAKYPLSECQHDDAKKFGCDPEFDAYDVLRCDPPFCEEGNTFRSGGGHLHIGSTMLEGDPTAVDEEAFKRTWLRIWTVRMADIFIGIPSLFIDHDPTSKARRKLYGGAGTHRVPFYGVEYRSLSNFWIAEPAKVQLMFDLASFIIDIVTVEKCHEHIWEEEISSENLRAVINGADKKKAEAFLPLLKKYMPKKLLARIDAMSTPKVTDFYAAWNIA